MAKSNIIDEIRCDNAEDYKRTQEQLFSKGLKWWGNGKQTLGINPYGVFPIYINIWDDETITHCSQPEYNS